MSILGHIVSAHSDHAGTLEQYRFGEVLERLLDAVRGYENVPFTRTVDMPLPAGVSRGEFDVAPWRAEA